MKIINTQISSHNQIASSNIPLTISLYGQCLNLKFNICVNARVAFFRGVHSPHTFYAHIFLQIGKDLERITAEAFISCLVFIVQSNQLSLLRFWTIELHTTLKFDHKNQQQQATFVAFCSQERLRNISSPIIAPSQSKTIFASSSL